MPGNMNIFLTVFCVLIMIFKTQATERYLQCWLCSSDTVQAEKFCDVDFSESSIPTEMLLENHISVVSYCNSSINSEHERPVCRKTVEEVNGKTIVKRFCYYTNKSDSLDHCQQQATDKNVKRIFCQDCITDKCNSAPQLLGISSLLILSILIVKKNMA